MNLSLTIGEDLVRKCPGEFVICPNGLEPVFVEEAISFADAEIVLVFWEVGKLIGKIQRGWVCVFGRIEGDRCWLIKALKCSPGCRFVSAPSGRSAEGICGTRRGVYGPGLRLATTASGAKKHHSITHSVVKSKKKCCCCSS